MRNARGISLVEVLVSIFILSIGLVSSSRCLTIALATNLRANRIALATEIAQSTVENQRSLGDLTASTTAITDPLLPGGKVTVAVSDYNVPLNIKRMTVTVTWNGWQSRKESVKLDTLVSKRTKHVGG